MWWDRLGGAGPLGWNGWDALVCWRGWLLAAGGGVTPPPWVVPLAAAQSPIYAVRGVFLNSLCGRVSWPKDNEAVGMSDLLCRL